MKRQLLPILALAAFLLPAVAAASETPVLIRGARPLAMGGAFIALSDDHNAMFYNPAGLTQRTGSQFTLFEMPLGASDDIFQFMDFYNNRKDDLDNFDKTLTAQQKIDLLNEINDKITTYRPQIHFGFPNVSYVSGPGYLSWGLGVFDQADIGFQFQRSLIVPRIAMWGNIDMVVAAPVAHKFDSIPSIPKFWKVPEIEIPGTVSVGATLKYINRASISESMSMLEFENMDPLLQMGNGFGLDFGTLYQPNKRWNYGLQISDLGGTSIKYAEVHSDKTGNIRAAHTEMIVSQWNVGASYIPSKVYYWPHKSINTLDRLILVCDLRDVLSSDERLFEDTFWKKLHMGAELRFATFSLRGGFNSGYPTFGFGLGIPYLGLRADYAFWGDELGRYAGQIPEWNHQVSLSFRWGAEKGKAFGSDVKAETAPVKAAEPVKQVEPPKEAAPAAAPAANPAVAPAAPAAPAATAAPATEKKNP